jgi:hypothetical protein
MEMVAVILAMFKLAGHVLAVHLHKKIVAKISFLKQVLYKSGKVLYISGKFIKIYA